MKSLRVPVLIVGAGPAGLAMAIELGTRSIGVLIVERNDRVGYAPRAKTTHTRTREHLRRWGIADRLAQASPFGVDYPSDIVFATRLGGHLLTRIENAFNCAPKRDERYSEHAQWIPQYRLEEVLREHVGTLASVELRFSHEFDGCWQETELVRSRLRDLKTGEIFEVLSDFVVGADGARSLLRDLIGAKLEGRYGLSRNYNIVFRAPGLAEAHSHGPAVMYWQVNAAAPSLIGPMDTDDRWFFMPTGVPDGMRLTSAEASALIRDATGIDLPYEILSTDEWVASEFIADAYSDGRVFLVGDACHVHPPFGGYGMNMGIADSVELGWKIAAVLDGWGGPKLLQSYERERRPLHRQVIDEAVANHAVLGNQLWREGLEQDGPEGVALRREVGEHIRDAKLREFKSLGVVLGYCYSDSPVIWPNAGEDSSVPLQMDYVPSGRAGCVAPHAWLDDGRSLYDLFGSGFTLLALDFAGGLGSVEADAADLQIPIKIVALERADLAERYGAPLALIRPDQQVAWRGEFWPGKPLLELVTGRARED